MTEQALSGVLAGREIELCHLFRAGLTSAEIGARMGVAAQTVGDACRRIGLRRGRGWQPPADRFDALAERVDTPQDRLARRIEALRAAGTLRACDFWTPDRDTLLAASGGGYEALADLARRWAVPQARLIARWHLMRLHLRGLV